MDICLLGDFEAIFKCFQPRACQRSIATVFLFLFCAVHLDFDCLHSCVNCKPRRLSTEVPVSFASLGLSDRATVP